MILALGIYLLVGVVIVGFFLGSCKVRGGWSASAAWTQFTIEGWRGVLFLSVVAVAWLPAAVFVLVAGAFRK